MNVITETEDTVRIRHQATTDVDTADLISVIVSCTLSELNLALGLFVIKSCKFSMGYAVV
jgi:hypothetical protein